MAVDSSARFLVSGKVQGVCFRAATRDEARRLKLRGHAKNLPDGRVEVLAVGDTAAVDALAQWLQHGPPRARVHGIDRRDAGDNAVAEGFSIG